MDAERRLDADRFPNFARSGRTRPGIATRPALGATRSSPSPRSDRRPRRLDSLPTAADHPRSLFTLLGESHGCMSRSRGRTSAPRASAKAGPRSLDEGGLGSLLATIPRSWDTSRCRMPSDSGSRVRGRAERSTGGHSSRSSSRRSRHPPDGQTSTFLHVLLPHKAWQYLPSGERYSDSVGAEPSLGGLEQWEDDAWLDPPARAAILSAAAMYTIGCWAACCAAARDRALRAIADHCRGGPRGVISRRGRAPRRDPDQRPRHPVRAALR